MTETATEPIPVPKEPPRRGFVTGFLAVVCGGIAGLVPAGAGVTFFLDPLRKRKSSGEGDASGFIKVAALSAVPADGLPVKFPVIADRQDAWNLFPKEPIGAVYLRKTDKGEVIAFNVICPHLGCAVDYSNSSKSFKCPCHDSSFTLDGAPSNSIPPRGMDTLEVDPARLKQGEVWVKFENFRTGEAHKVPKV
ncbi:MAG: Rieske 2Fe-2S domain-containing protein [Planctomycetales bacterium]